MLLKVRDLYLCIRKLCFTLLLGVEKIQCNQLWLEFSMTNKLQINFCNDCDKV